MGISAVSSSSTTPQTQTDNGWQQFMQLAKAIQSGDTNAAQQALASLKPQGHHHHHHHGGGGAAQAGGSAQPTVPTDPNAPGANVNVTA